MIRSDFYITVTVIALVAVVTKLTRSNKQLPHIMTVTKQRSKKMYMKMLNMISINRQSSTLYGKFLNSLVSEPRSMINVNYDLSSDALNKKVSLDTPTGPIVFDFLLSKNEINISGAASKKDIEETVLKCYHGGVRKIVDVNLITPSVQTIKYIGCLATDDISPLSIDSYNVSCFLCDVETNKTSEDEDYSTIVSYEKNEPDKIFGSNLIVVTNDITSGVKSILDAVVYIKNQDVVVIKGYLADLEENIKRVNKLSVDTAIWIFLDDEWPTCKLFDSINLVTNNVIVFSDKQKFERPQSGWLYTLMRNFIKD